MKEGRTPTVAELLAAPLSDPSRPSNLLQTLLLIQEQLGYIPHAAIPLIAQSLGVSNAQVVGVLSYYPDLRTEPAGRHLVRVCIGESCMANHGGRVLSAIRDHLHINGKRTGSNSSFTVEAVSCVGNCALSPTVMIDHDLYGRVTPSQIPILLEPYRT